MAESGEYPIPGERLPHWSIAQIFLHLIHEGSIIVILFSMEEKMGSRGSWEAPSWELQGRVDWVFQRHVLMCPSV
jgi:hypothetical protein